MDNRIPNPMTVLEDQKEGPHPVLPTLNYSNKFIGVGAVTM